MAKVFPIYEVNPTKSSLMAKKLLFNANAGWRDYFINAPIEHIYTQGGVTRSKQKGTRRLGSSLQVRETSLMRPGSLAKLFTFHHSPGEVSQPFSLSLSLSLSLLSYFNFNFNI